MVKSRNVFSEMPIDVGIDKDKLHLKTRYDIIKCFIVFEQKWFANHLEMGLLQIAWKIIDDFVRIHQVL